MSRSSHGFAGALVVLLLTFYAGCQSSDRAYVEGVVTLNGHPLSDASVMFVSAKQRDVIAYGRSDHRGWYRLASGGAQGLPTGEYQVGCAAYELAPPANALATPSSKLITPFKFADPQTSGLLFKIGPGVQTVDLTLQSTSR